MRRHGWLLADVEIQTPTALNFQDRSNGVEVGSNQGLVDTAASAGGEASPEPEGWLQYPLLHRPAPISGQASIGIDGRHVGLIDSMDVRRSYIPRICHVFATMQVGLTHGAASFPTAP